MLDLPLFDEEHRAFSAGLKSWLDEVAAAEDESDAATTSRAWVRALAEGGWLRACVPGVYGGLRADLDVRTLCLARERLAYRSALADFAFAMQGLGGGPIALYGSAELKRRYLPEIAAGRCIGAFALSEFEAGSDVGALTTRARRENGGYVIDGEKAWISNAGIANLYVVFARTGEAGPKGLSAFAVDAAANGCRMERPIETISPHPLGSLRLDGVRVSNECRIGQEGEGFKIAMAVLDVFRSTVGAAAIGFARRALDESVTHVKTRQLFGKPLADLQLTQAARVTREAAMAKWFATEAAGRVCDRAVQLFGGRGVTRGEIVERLYRDVRALRIYEGASEIQQLVIARQLLAT
jgi:acyl-CoA dehydrogenase